MKQKRNISFLLFILSLVLIFYYSCTKDKGPLPVAPVVQAPCDIATIKYSTDILPIIQANCAIPTCHVVHGLGADYSTYAGVAANADPPLGNGSIRARALNGGTSATGSGWMPKTTGPLPLIDREKIDCWLKAGAPNN